jgi:PAS domain S-box-containing protein
MRLLRPDSVERKRGYLLLVIMTAVAIGVASVTLVFLYRAAFEQQRERLVEIAQGRARLMEAMAREAKNKQGDSHWFASTIFQLRDAHARFVGFGETGEFTLARLEDEQIVFLLSHRHQETESPPPVPFESALAEPMRRALSGRSGTLVGVDYRGEIVMAAHEPVEILELGIVAKIDLHEVRKPFFRAGLLASGVGLAFIALGLVLFLRIGGPLIRQLEKNQEMLAQAQRIGHIGSWDCDVRRGVSTFSDEMYRILGLEPQQREWSMEDFLEYVHPEDREYVEREYQNALDTDAHYSVVHRIVHADGAEKVVHGEARIERDSNGEPIRVIGIDRDISDQMRTEQQLKSSVREKEVLLREIHHRVKNNLQVISSLLALQVRGEDNEDVVQALRDCERRVQTMALVHNKIYHSGDLAHIDFGDYLGEVIPGLMEAYCIDGSQIDLETELEAVVLGIDQAIPCAQVISELVSNAVKHAFPDNRKGTLHIGLRLLNEQRAELVVSDDGVGLPDNIEAERPGSLGLWLVSALTSQLGGKVSRDSSSGTTFTLTFDIT